MSPPKDLPGLQDHCYPCLMGVLARAEARGRALPHQGAVQRVPILQAAAAPLRRTRQVTRNTEIKRRPCMFTMSGGAEESQVAT